MHDDDDSGGDDDYDDNNGDNHTTLACSFRKSLWIYRHLFPHFSYIF